MKHLRRDRLKRDPERLALQRKQLDKRMTSAAHTEPAPGGWIRAVRTALGMSSSQLARRVGVTPDAIVKAERSERLKSISIATLSKIADALECDVVVQLKPRTSLDELMRRRALEKARAERNRVVHTMRLEAQHDGVEQALDVDDAAREWMTTRIANLWD